MTHKELFPAFILPQRVGRYSYRRLSTGFFLVSDIMASFMRPSIGRYTLLPSASSWEDVSVERQSVLCSMDGRGMYEWCGPFSSSACFRFVTESGK